MAVVFLPRIGPRSSTLRIVTPLHGSSWRIGTYLSNGSTGLPPFPTMEFVEPSGNVHGAADHRSNRRGRYDPGTIRLEQGRIVSRLTAPLASQSDRVLLLSTLGAGIAPPDPTRLAQGRATPPLSQERLLRAAGGLTPASCGSR